MKRAFKIAETVLSFGLNLLIARLGVNPRWRLAIWGLIAANEIRGFAVVWQFGEAALKAVV